MVTIKSITTNVFAISLVEDSKGHYRIIYATHNKTMTSERIFDFKLSLQLFDLKYDELNYIQ